MIRVTNMRLAMGAHLGAKVYTSIDSKLDRMELEMGNKGIWISKEKSKYFIPFGNIASVEVDPESFEMSPAKDK